MTAAGRQTSSNQQTGGEQRAERLPIERGGRLQRRTVLVLSVATILGGLGVGASLSVGALLLAEVSGNDAISGLGSAMFNAGAAAAGIPLARVAMRHGRRRALVTGSIISMFGALIAIVASALGNWVLLAVGIALVGVSSAVQLMSRFAATDLALPSRRARDLSLVVWSITIGAVVGPNLIAPGAVVGEWLGVPSLAGVFAFPFIAQLLAVLVNWFGLRPDPLLAARQLPYETASVTVQPQQTTAPEQTQQPQAPQPAPRPSNRPQVLMIFMIAMAQAIMVALMAMTPLHLMHHEGTPQIVGLTLSLHIAGMYALSPVFGMMAGKLGRLQTIGIGWLMLFAAIGLSYVAGASHLLVQIALVLLGLGWGAVTVAGAALLTEVTPAADRPRWQGRSDTVMSGAGAVAGALSGVAFSFGDFSFLALVTGVLLLGGVLATLWARPGSR